MKPARRLQLESLYNQAREMEENQQAAFLREACGGDEDLRRDLEGLLAEEPQAARFPEKAGLLEIAHEFAATAAQPQRSWIGRKIGNYEFVSLAGAGGMGEVYRARDTKLKRDVAIKILRDEFSLDSEWVSRFRREAQLLASLNHPSIAAIYDLEEADGHLFLILELVDGETLADRIRRGPIAVEEALKIALQIAEALESAHEKNVIHRDLKPANIKVTAESKVKVLDFGLAKALLGDAGGNLSNSSTMSMAETQQGVILGTAAYMSPEQARGQAVDRRADVWAFGCVLFEMLSGRGTFGGKTVSDVIASVLKTAPDWSSLPADLHPRILHLLERCLDKEPKDRCQGLADARVEIKKVLADAGAVPAKPATGARAGLRSRLPWIAAVMAATVIASILIGVFKPTAPAAILEFPFLIPEDQGFTHLRTSSLAISRDGTHIAYAAGGQLYLGDTNAMAPRPIPGSKGRAGIGQPVFSRDGQWLAYLDVGPNGTTSLKKIPVSGGAPVTLIEDSPAPKLGVSWTANDTILFATTGAIQEISAAAAGATPTVLIKAAAGERLGSPELLPGGKSLLFSVNSEKIFVQQLKSGDRILVWEGGGDPHYVATGHVVYANGSALFALPFEMGSLKKKGGPTQIPGSVRRGRGATETANYDISDTGTLVYVPETALPPADNVLALVDRNGVSRKLNVPPKQYRGPRWSPDGLKLAVEAIGNDGRSSIWIYDPSGASEIRPLTQTGSNTHPTWTRDSQSVTFASNSDSMWKIYSQRADAGTPSEPLTTGQEGIQQLLPNSWSPNGRTLSFVKTGAGGWSIWTYSLDNRKSELFHQPTGGFNDFGSVFSPDGNWIAFATALRGIYVQPFPTGQTRPVIQDGSGPVWSRQNELFFRQGPNVQQPVVQLMAMDVSAKGTFIEFRKLRPLPVQNNLMFPNDRDYDISPDGNQFVVIVPSADSSAKPTTPARDRIQIVVNWFEQLKALMPPR